MQYFVIGEDKGFEHGYSASEVDMRLQTVNALINTSNMNISTLQNNVKTLQTGLNTANTNINGKQKKITSGTAAPSGGSNGDIYIQY